MGGMCLAKFGGGNHAGRGKVFRISAVSAGSAPASVSLPLPLPSHYSSRYYSTNTLTTITTPFALDGGLDHKSQLRGGCPRPTLYEGWRKRAQDAGGTARTDAHT